MVMFMNPNVEGLFCYELVMENLLFLRLTSLHAVMLYPAMEIIKSNRKYGL